MSVLDAAAAILRQVDGGPLNAPSITKHMVGQELWTTEGKTPAATVRARLTTDIKRHGEQSRFRKAGRGLYELNPVVEEQLATYRRVYGQAHAAGLAAVPDVEQWRDQGGNVGWGWVVVQPADRGFGKWLADERLGGRPMAGGAGIAVDPPSLAITNVEPQYRYCQAFAEVVRASGILERGGTCEVDGRLDGDF